MQGKLRLVLPSVVRTAAQLPPQPHDVPQAATEAALYVHVSLGEQT